MRNFAKVVPGVLMGMTLLNVQCTKDLEGEYADPDKVEIVDDRWNETDARKTAQAQIKAMLEKPWLAEFEKANPSKRPIVIVDEVENRTDEHIDVKALTEYVQDELLNSGKVRFLDKGARQKILDEIKYQQESGAVAKDKAMAKGKQYGAQYMLAGALSSSVHSEGKLKTVTYQTLLTLTNLETAEIEWSDKYLIKKRFNRGRGKW